MPLHLFVGRRIAFATFQVPGPPRDLDAQGAGERKLVHQGGAARRVKHDDLLEKVACTRLRGQIAAAGLGSSARSCTRPATVRRMPAPSGGG